MNIDKVKDKKNMFNCDLFFSIIVLMVIIIVAYYIFWHEYE